MVDKEPSASRETEEALEQTSKHHIQRWPAFKGFMVSRPVFPAEFIVPNF